MGAKKDVMAWKEEEQAHADKLREDEARSHRLLEKRQKAAEDAFTKADTDYSGTVSREELCNLLLLRHQLLLLRGEHRVQIHRARR